MNDGWLQGLEIARPFSFGSGTAPRELQPEKSAFGTGRDLIERRNVNSHKRYIVTFFKIVTDDYGSDREICECVIKLHAVDEGSAVAQAKEEFCRSKGLHDWSAHADRYEVVPSDRTP